MLLGDFNARMEMLKENRKGKYNGRMVMGCLGKNCFYYLIGRNCVKKHTSLEREEVRGV